MTLAIAHEEQGVVAVLDLVRELRPRFNPDDVVRDFAGVLATYGLAVVHGDAYAQEWVQAPFRQQGLRYEVSPRPAAALYAMLLPAVNARRVELLDHPRLLAQLAGLERRAGPSGRDTIVHPRGGHDDVANAVAGALVVAAPGRAPLIILDGSGGDLSEPGVSPDDFAFDAETLARAGGVWFPGDPWPTAEPEEPGLGRLSRHQRPPTLGDPARPAPRQDGGDDDDDPDAPPPRAKPPLEIL
jgi:hypothetical protein